MWRRIIELGLRVAAPAQVVAYDPILQEVQCLVGFLSVRKKVAADIPGQNPNDTNEVEVQPPMPLKNIPVRFEGGGLGARVTYDLIPGDTGTLLVHDRSLQAWLLGLGQPADPQISWAHKQGDCEFIPGLRPKATRLTPQTIPASLVVAHDVAVFLGGDTPAALPVARTTDLTVPAPDMATWMAQVTAALAAMAPGFNAAPPGTPVLSLGPGSVVPPVPPAGFGIISTGSPKVRAD